MKRLHIPLAISQAGSAADSYGVVYVTSIKYEDAVTLAFEDCLPKVIGILGDNTAIARLVGKLEHIGDFHNLVEYDALVVKAHKRCKELNDD